MHRLKVTNIGKLPKYLIEAGKLLQPGESTTCNRVDAGTRRDPSLKIEEGQFPKPSPAAKVKVGPQRYDDDDDDSPPKKKAPVVDDGPARLVDSRSRRRSVPLVAEDAAAMESAVASAENGPDEEWGGKDELDAEIPKAEKVSDDKSEDSEPAGFVTRRGLPADDDLDSMIPKAETVEVKDVVAEGSGLER